MPTASTIGDAKTERAKSPVPRGKENKLATESSGDPTTPKAAKRSADAPWETPKAAKSSLAETPKQAKLAAETPKQLKTAAETPKSAKPAPAASAKKAPPAPVFDAPKAAEKRERSPVPPKRERSPVPTKRSASPVPAPKSPKPDEPKSPKKAAPAAESKPKPPAVAEPPKPKPASTVSTKPKAVEAKGYPPAPKAAEKNAPAPKAAEKNAPAPKAAEKNGSPEKKKEEAPLSPKVVKPPKSPNPKFKCTLERPTVPVGEPWPEKSLTAFTTPPELGWGPLFADIMKERGWHLRAPCHTRFDENTRKWTVYMKEFEALVRGKKPEEIWSEEEVTMRDGYKLRTLRVPSHAFFSMGYASYIVPETGLGREYYREDFAMTLIQHGSELQNKPGWKPGNFRMIKFPGMETALYKTSLSLAFREKDWYPVAYVLPKEKDELLAAMAAGGDKQKNLWIAKPKNNYAGAGIVVYPGNSDELQELVKDSENHPKSLVQRYLADPLLIGGYKFHMRIHLCITSLDPLEGYVQENGQCLFATKPYHLKKCALGANFDPPVHVTNMGLNATPENKDAFFFQKPVIGKGQQLRMAELEAWLKKHHSQYDKQELWEQITHIAAETVRYISRAPAVRKNLPRLLPQGHFEILGMDLMLDNNLKVYMCEVNGDPGLDYPDKEVLEEPNPDFDKESSACTDTWHDLLTLLGLDANFQKQKGSLAHWFKLDFSKLD